MAQLDVTQTFTGARILFLGATGFLGKVTLSQLLHRYGGALGRVYVLVRKGSSKSSHQRFYDKVARSEPFGPLRESLGEDGAQRLLEEKIVVLDGDISDRWLGLSDAQVAELTGQVDVVVNCAGLVSFTPPLEVALKVNTHGAMHLVELCRAWKAPLVHVSTAFVAGNRSGLVFEDEPVVGYFPRQEELVGQEFSLAQELEDCAKSVARLREEAEDRARTSTFRTRALERLQSEGRNTDDAKTLRLAIARERKLWLTGELVRTGMDRAAHWGWPNTYTYSKSLGEQAIVGAEDLSYAIVRPSIVESAERFPFPGWNEGFTTSAPLAFEGLKNPAGIPAGADIILDLIPVDHVSGAIIGVTARILKERDRRVFHLASGDLNPFYASRTVELVGLYRRRHWRARETGNAWVRDFKSRLEPQPLEKRAFELLSTPMFSRGAKLLTRALEQATPEWGAPRLQAAAAHAKRALEEVSGRIESFHNLSTLFSPFLLENRYVFRCDNVREMVDSLTPEDRARIHCSPQSIDWRNYFLEVHLPGLEKWVFPGMEDERKRRRSVNTYRDLLELFDGSVHAFRHRVAFRMLEGEREERFTFGQTQHWSHRFASWLLAQGLSPQQRVVLLSENRPEWGMAYFGILRAAGVAVPVDKGLSTPELINIVRRSEATVILASEACLTERPELQQALADAGLTARIASLAEAMAGDPAAPDGIRALRRGAGPDELASLIFTSGTTGTPKGVMLTHRNFAALVARLSGTFELGEGDGLLSVLPLHHTFEFACGFLTPFSLGAEVSYIDELTADRLGEVLEEGRITAMIGVPALWQLLHRRITQEMASRPRLVEELIKGLMGAHGELRNRSDLNLGKLLFWPVHRRFGGKLKLLISGGSALPDDVHQAFHQLGFRITEGYGLTEAAPVIAVSPLDNQRIPGTVGKPLPGIEVRILEPDGEGVGEVVVRGPNVMAGYFGDEAATGEVLREGWLHTGDLGRLDAEGRLFLVGRKKDVIIDANGKNVYPDEIEELYRHHPHIEELSVVGLPDASGGERVACLCVPSYGERPREEVRRELEAHFRKVSQTQPFARRVKVLRFTDVPLEKTSTRKVKRRAVIQELEKLERRSAESTRLKTHSASEGDWVLGLVAQVSQRPAAEVTPEARLTADLGFDSLLLTELSAALEQAGLPLPAVNDLSQVETVADLMRLVGSSARRPAARLEAKDLSERVARDEDADIEVPAAVSSLGRQLVAFGQKVLYGGVFEVKTTGKAYVPQNRNLLVVANHTSHLDMGLVKSVLGEQGEKLTTLAARDYFFDTPLKRAYFENFTNLIPMDRQGSLRDSLRAAGEALRQGWNLLIFPEGTRSPTGELLEFKPTLGFLALSYDVDVLPIYIEGAHAALPKGSLFPKQRELEVRIGPVIEASELRRRTRGMSRSESYRFATRLAQVSVEALRDGSVMTLQRIADPPQGDLDRPAAGGASSRRLTQGGEA